jgi:2',3'-cyclic-nucleotide 2'-phosphodiesterase/3'-nucleotidase
MIMAMNALGYDAATLGNHDFDYGIDMLDRILSDAAFPVVLANAQHPGNGEPFRPRHVILEREVEDLDGDPSPPSDRRDRNRAAAGRPMEPRRPERGSSFFEDAVEATAREARLLKAAGADIVVALAHSGLGDSLPVRRRQGRHPPATARKTSRGPSPPPGCRRRGRGPHPRGLSHRCAIATSFRPNPRSCSRASGGRTWDASTRPVAGARMTRQAGRSSRPMPRRCPERPGCATRAGALKGRPARQVRTCARPSAGCIARPVRKSRLQDRRKRSSRCTPISAPSRPAARRSYASDAQRRGRVAGRSPDLVGDLTICRSSAVSPMRSGGRAGPTSSPTSRRDRSCSACLGPLLLPQCARGPAPPGAISPDWLERAASIFHRIDPDDPSPQPLIDHDFAGYNFDRLDGLPTTSTSACPRNRCPGRAHLRHARAHPEPAPRRRHARRPRGGRSGRHEFLPRGGRR